MFRIKLAMIVGGAVLAFFGIQEYRVSSGTSTEPAEVSLADIEKGNALENNHMIVGPHIAYYYGCVYEYEESSRGSGETPGSKVTHLYYPICSEDNEFFDRLNAVIEKHGSMEDSPEAELPDLEQFVVMVKTKRFKTVGTIPTNWIQPEDSVQGLVVNLTGGPDKEERELFRDTFPNVDLDKVLILEDGRKPAPLYKTLGMTLGGALLSMLGLGSFFVGGGSSQPQHA